MKLTIDSIQKAMTNTSPYGSREFWLDPKGESAQIVEEATRRGYIRRYSTTQVEWTEEGLKRARQELAESKTIAVEDLKRLLCKTCGDLSRNDLKSLGAFIVFRDEILARLAKL
jgi:hypothetical protein